MSGTVRANKAGLRRGSGDAAGLRLEPGEQLLATMAAVGGVGVVHLGEHLRRLQESARAFGVDADPARWRRAVDDWVGGPGAPAPGRVVRVRLLVDATGRPTVAARPLDPVPARPVRLAVDDRPVDEGDERWRHKTTDRRRYDERAGRHPGADDVVLVNRRGMLTETTRANVLVRLDGRWWTPPASCGCLPGVGRHVLVGRAVVGEREIGVDELRAAQAVAVVSSLRGWRAGLLVSPAPRPG